MVGGAATAAWNAVGVGGVPLCTSVTPLGRKVETPIFIALSSGTGRFHDMSQFGDSVGNAQAEASIANAKIPTAGRRMYADSVAGDFREGPFAAEAGVGLLSYRTVKA